MTPALVNEDIETGDILIKDRLATIGKSTTDMLSIKEKKIYQRKIEKDPKFDNYRIGKPVLLDIPVQKSFIEKETAGKVSVWKPLVFKKFFQTYRVTTK